MLSVLVTKVCLPKRIILNPKSWQYIPMLHTGCVHHIPSANNSTDVSHQTLYETWFNKDSPPIWFAQQVLETGHDFTHLPWWGSIVMTTVVLRAGITLPLAVYQNYIMAKVELLQPQIKGFAVKLKQYLKDKGAKENWHENRVKRIYTLQMKKAVKNFYIRDNCHPFKASILIWVQLPMWICISFALRNMTGVFPGKLAQALTSEGCLWFPDLTQSDPYWILPIMLGLTNLLVIEMHALRPTEPSKFQRRLTIFLRCLSVAMVPIAASLPTAMSLYWTVSSVFGLSQNLLLKSPKFRRISGIPKLSGESVTPYKDMLNIAKGKLLRTNKNKENR
ncbi:cytochrome c oxidase assembly protein COX18, mitochondrial-like isoform X2 [Glandiceps talaboti]